MKISRMLLAGIITVFLSTKGAQAFAAGSFWCDGLWESSGRNYPAWLDVDVGSDGLTTVTWTQMWLDWELGDQYTKTAFILLNCVSQASFSLQCHDVANQGVSVAGWRRSPSGGPNSFAYLITDPMRPYWNHRYDGVEIGQTLLFDHCAYK